VEGVVTDGETVTVVVVVHAVATVRERDSGIDHGLLKDLELRGGFDSCPAGVVLDLTSSAGAKSELKMSEPDSASDDIPECFLRLKAFLTLASPITFRERREYDTTGADDRREVEGQRSDSRDVTDPVKDAHSPYTDVEIIEWESIDEAEVVSVDELL
jgi:hypothetical protein